MNVRTLGALLAHAKTSASPLALAFLDIRGAYDNVSQDSLQRACVRLGVPQPIRSYLSSLYKQSRTKLCYGGQIVTDEVETARGVKQGAPSSCSLFNAVMDLVTSSTRADMGAEVAKGARVSHLLFADDTVLVANTPELLQLCLEKFTDELEGVGLWLNPSKSSALVIRHTRGKWGVDSGVSIVDRDGIRLPMLGVQDSYKYLGLQFGSEGFKWQPAQKVLEKGLREITTAPLNAGQRLYILRNHLIPKLMHVLVLAMAPRQFLVNELGRDPKALGSRPDTRWNC